MWGAAGPDAWDCSGLTMGSWAAAGVYLPHYSVAQYAALQHISFSELQPGDLVFWGSTSSPSSIYHVALYIGNNQIIQAPAHRATSKVSSLYDWTLPNFYGRVKPLRRDREATTPPEPTSGRRRLSVADPGRTRSAQVRARWTAAAASTRLWTRWERSVTHVPASLAMRHYPGDEIVLTDALDSRGVIGVATLGAPEQACCSPSWTGTGSCGYINQTSPEPAWTSPSKCSLIGDTQFRLIGRSGSRPGRRHAGESWWMASRSLGSSPTASS